MVYAQFGMAIGGFCSFGVADGGLHFHVFFRSKHLKTFYGKIFYIETNRALDTCLDNIRHLLVWSFSKKDVKPDAFTEWALGSYSAASSLCTNIKFCPRSAATK